MRAGQVPPGCHSARSPAASVQVVRLYGTSTRRADYRGNVRTENNTLGAKERMEPVVHRRATPFARTSFAIWGLMSEIIGAAIVVFGSFFAALALAGMALVMFF